MTAPVAQKVACDRCSDLVDDLDARLVATEYDEAERKEYGIAVCDECYAEYYE